MTQSMTAFARAEAELAAGTLVWEIRSVNHRYLDINLKLPEELRLIEGECRTKISENLNRGRVDGILKFERKAGQSFELQINQENLNALINALQDVQAINSEILPARSSDILKWPGVLQDSPLDLDEITQHALSGLENALTNMVESRQREGLRMAELIQDRVSGCREITQQLRQLMPEIEEAAAKRWQEKLSTLEHELDPVRVNQEMTLLLTKMDVSEEIDRLASHLDEVEKVIKSKKPSGRRLDFLMQELNREANTLGSKSIDKRTTNASVNLKVLIDQMREQIQNIE